MPEPKPDENAKRPAAPLQLVGLGLVVVFLETSGGYDAFANPLGWVLVLLGTARLPLAERGVLTSLAMLAFVVAVPLWFPAVHEPVLDADPSLDWAAKLPTYAYAFVLCRALMAAAKPTHPGGYMRFATLSVLLAVAVAVPPVAIAADSAWVANAGITLIIVAQVWLLWSLFSHSRRSYADAPAAPAPTSDGHD